MSLPLTLQNVTLPDGQARTLHIGPDGRFAENAAPGWETVDAEGRLAVPPFADPHVHLDKTFVAATNESGTLAEAIRRWRELRPALTGQDYLRRGERALRRCLHHGTTAVRTHVDVAAGDDFSALRAMLLLRERWAPRLTLQIVALGNMGTSAGQDWAMAEALRLGADGLGGCPALVEDPQRLIDRTLDLAERHGAFVDLHVDETEDPQMLTLEMLARTVKQRRFALPVAAGHCCSLACVGEETAARVIGAVAEAGIAVLTLPSCNMALQGRGCWPAPRGITRVKQLRAAGVPVAAGSDNVRDPFNPFGDYNPLLTAQLLAHAAHLTAPQEMRSALAMVGKQARQVMGLPAPSTEPGQPAHLVLLDTPDAESAVAACPPIWKIIGEPAPGEA